MIWAHLFIHDGTLSGWARSQYNHTLILLYPWVAGDHVVPLFVNKTNGPAPGALSDLAGAICSHFLINMFWFDISYTPLIPRLIGPTWGPHGADRAQDGAHVWPHELCYLGLPRGYRVTGCWYSRVCYALLNVTFAPIKCVQEQSTIITSQIQYLAFDPRHRPTVVSSWC